MAKQLTDCKPPAMSQIQLMESSKPAISVGNLRLGSICCDWLAACEVLDGGEATHTKTLTQGAVSISINL